MTCPTLEQWNLLSMRLLDGDEAEQMIAHAKACAGCREAMQRVRLLHADLIQAHEAFDQSHDLLRQKLMDALPAEPAVPEEARVIRRCTRDIGAAIMKMRTYRPARAAAALLPAACILIAAVVYFMPSDQKVFAAVLTRLREAESIVCRVTITMRASFEAVGQAEGLNVAELNNQPALTYVRREHISIDPIHGLKREAFSGETLISTTYARPDGTTLVLNHEQRTYDMLDPQSDSAMPESIRAALRDQLAERPVPEFHLIGLSSSPETLIESLRDLTMDADRALGRRMIAGEDAVGFEIGGEKVGFGPPFFEDAEDIRVEVWVYADSAVPAQLVLNFTARMAQIRDLPLVPTYKVTALYDQFELDVPLAAELFEPVIPDDYRPGGFTELQQPLPSDEAEMIEALRLFAEHAGRYPQSLQLMDLAYELSYLMGSLQARRLAAERKGEDTSNLPDIQVVGQKLHGLMYFATLATGGHNPVYLGESVQPDDADSVLLRWTLDDQRSRVIYGDLRAETLP